MYPVNSRYGYYVHRATFEGLAKRTAGDRPGFSFNSGVICAGSSYGALMSVLERLHRSSPTSWATCVGVLANLGLAWDLDIPWSSNYIHGSKGLRD